MHALAANKPVHQTLLFSRDGLPARDGIGVVEETDIEDKLLEIAQGHLRVLRVGRGWVERQAPAKRFLLFAPALHLANLRVCLTAPRRLRGIDVAQSPGIALGCDRQPRVKLWRDRAEELVRV